ncbi:glycosyltransferase [Vibrio cholerae]|nr:glycosyltransferase [Vibrio cholerae]
MKIGVVVCIYQPDLLMLQEQIESILSQTKKVDIVYFFDDSPYCIFLENKEFIANLFNNITSIDFEVLVGPRKGVSNNFLSSLSYTDADVIFFCDQDDVWLPNKVELFINEFASAKGAMVVFSDAKIVDNQLNVISDSFIQSLGLTDLTIKDDTILIKNCVQGASMAINSDLIELVITSSNDLNKNFVPMHDWWIAVLAHFFGDYRYIDQPTLLYRQHDRNLVGATKKTFKDKFKIGYLIAILKITYQIYKVHRFYLLRNGRPVNGHSFTNVNSLKVFLVKIVSFFSSR